MQATNALWWSMRIVCHGSPTASASARRLGLEASPTDAAAASAAPARSSSVSRIVSSSASTSRAAAASQRVPCEARTSFSTSSL